ncbi:outer membrane beta-barrel protein [Aquimarina agarilytica]|uniref:outer membrane beta-barrel protein n=1 Tax=Aquimarina agarilytica TaxID=1087449 RepID=UPI000289A247|nr:outer membrane beta-barrel protein [Aquimarina agarilytica]
MKKILVLSIMLIMGLSCFAQKKGKVRFGMDVSYATLTDFKNQNFGYGSNFEFKYNLKKNMNIGIRYGAVLLFNTSKSTTDNQEGFFTVGLTIPLLATYDYYFNKGGSSFAPYLGGGFGINAITVTEYSYDLKKGRSDKKKENEINIDDKFSGMLRAGFEWHKLRLEASYHLIPDSKLNNLNGDIIGKSKNSYLNLALGFYIGGGKWKNKA